MIIFLSLWIEIGSLVVGISLNFHIEKVVSHRANIVILGGMRVLKDLSSGRFCLFSDRMKLWSNHNFSLIRNSLLCIIKFLNGSSHISMALRHLRIFIDSLHHNWRLFVRHFYNRS